MANNLVKKEQKYVIEKSNALNEMLSHGWTLQELRFFGIYLAKINARNPNTRFVRLSLEDFGRIMDLTDVRERDIKPVTDRLLQKIIRFKNEFNGHDAFQLFKRCRTGQTDNGQWYVEMDAHDEALPLIFGYKTKYFKYELWNTVNLTSVNQWRMYEFLKQYENLGERIETVEYLRHFLGIEPNEYSQWTNFRIKVLEACQKALAENTDIKFTYEVYSRRGKGGKILSLRFIIEKNENYVCQLRLHEFVDINETEAALAEKEYQEHKRWGRSILGNRPPNMDEERANIAGTLAVCFNYEFSWAQLDSILNTLDLMGLCQKLNDVDDGSRVMAWLSGLYDDMCRRYDEKQNTKDRIKNRFKYFTGMIKKDSKSALDALNMAY